MEQDSSFYSLPEYISTQISKDILQGRIKAGGKLVEAVFQERFQVSKSPVREAFQMLINSGLVERKNRRGCFVKVLTPDEIEHIYEVRMNLEALAAKEAYIKMTKDQLKRLQELYAAMERDVKADDAIGYLRHHNKFQKFFGEVSGNNVLVEICEKLRVQNMWYNTQFFQIDLKKDLETHVELMRHFAERDIEPDQIERIMHDHIGIGLENFRIFMKMNGISGNL